MRRLSLAIASIVALGIFRPGYASSASILVEANSGYVLHAEDADALWYPASLTKLMTVLLVFEALEAGDVRLSDLLKVSPAAAAQPPTELGLAAGQFISVETAIRATILRSANDAAVVLAETLSGTEEAFAARMTDRARELGMASTVFRNATGLPNDGQVTTARDMAVLARYLLRKMPSHVGYFAETWMTYGDRRLSTINGFVASYDGASGMKTGFTCASGYNMVASATRGDRTLIAVVLGAADSAGRAIEVRRLMNEGFATDGTDDPRPMFLASYIHPTPEERAEPPTVIPQSECGPIRVARYDATLPGWGLLVGSFNERGQAATVARRSRERIGSTDGARPVVLQRRKGRARRYSALIVGLSRADTRGACAVLRKQGTYCLVLGPKALNNPRALWR